MNNNNIEQIVPREILDLFPAELIKDTRRALDLLEQLDKITNELKKLGFDFTKVAYDPKEVSKEYTLKLSNLLDAERTK